MIFVFSDCAESFQITKTMSYFVERVENYWSFLLRSDGII